MSLVDAQVRLDAAADLDRNVIVTAGAGTGKTRLLVDRLVHLLVGRGVPLRRIVALTFTDKAANEMRIRLAERLETLAAVAREGGLPASLPGIRDPESATAAADEVQFDLLRKRYRLPSDEIAKRALAARADLDQALIGTIHSFAAHVLRLFPVEAGVDPTFDVDTGTAFEASFAREWASWLGVELGEAAPRRDAWLGVLARLDLDDVEAVAKALSNFLVPSPLPPAAAARRRLAEVARERAAGLEAAAKTCVQPANNLATQMRDYANRLRALAKAGGVSRAAAGQGTEASSRPGAKPDLLDKEVSQAKRGWTEESFAAARDLAVGARKLLHACRAIDDGFLDGLAGLLEPFVDRFRQRFLADRRISFDGLLALARRLVQDSLRAQERLKREFAAILVDEFQDTDPVQAELLLFLAQKPGRPVRRLEEVELAPGKLFVVGDPKQSIYGFRRADIAAFDWVKGMILRQGGREYALESNFRSDARIVRVVNAVFERILREEPGLQPPHRALAPARDADGRMERASPPASAKRRSAGRATGASRADAPAVEIRLVRPAPGGDAESGREAEAEQIARWIAGYVAAGGAYRDVALLLRALPPVHAYLEAFKRHAIPYLVEGERHFFSNPEVVDIINLLRAVENPHDRIALAGLLRSPLGGVSDRAIQALAQAGRLDYRLEVPAGADGREALEDLFARLRSLHARARRLPPDGLVEALFADLPVLEAAAAAYHGEQRVANLHKIRRLAAEWAEEPGLTLGGFVRRLAAAMEEGAEEGESPLADETVDAVRVLSIHKSKGLEFPVVILANLHGEPRAGREDAPVISDWQTGSVGIAAGDVRSTAHVVAGLRAERREAAEARRVLYVAMTRAKDRLVLSGVAGGGKRCLLELLEEAAGTPLGGAGGAERDGGGPGASPPVPAAVAFGPVSVPLTILDPAKPATPRKARAAAPERETDWVGWRERWARRRERAETWAALRRFTSPSRLEEERGDLALFARDPAAPDPGRASAPAARHPEPGTPARVSSRPAIVGTLCHRVLEHWDFAAPATALPEAVSRAAAVLREAEARDDWEEAGREALAILRAFHGSPGYTWIRGCEILGREIPILLPRAGGQAVRGVIDLLVRDGDRITVVDYKSDLVAREDRERQAEAYRLQGAIYQEAVRKAAGAEAAFRLVFLRDGATVDVR